MALGEKREVIKTFKSLNWHISTEHRFHISTRLNYLTTSAPVETTRAFAETRRPMLKLSDVVKRVHRLASEM